VTYANFNPLTAHDIILNTVNSYIHFNVWYGGLSIQVYGHGFIFCESEGMFGSWNYGGVRFPNGTAFDLSGGWSGTCQRSFVLAEACMVPLSDSELYAVNIVLKLDINWDLTFLLTLF
jgi:hypothetical protein